MTKTDLRDDASLAAIRSVGWPRSGWNGGRDAVGIGGRLRWNPHTTSAADGGSTVGMPVQPDGVTPQDGGELPAD